MSDCCHPVTMKIKLSGGTHGPTGKSDGESFSVSQIYIDCLTLSVNGATSEYGKSKSLTYLLVKQLVQLF